MNEERKEQNIPAPAPPESYNQKIAPVNRWQIKSWQIALAGVVIQLIAVKFFNSNSSQSVTIVTDFLINKYNFLLFLLIWIIIIKILYDNEEKKNKAAISFFVGFCSIFVGQYIVGMFLIFAAERIYFFRKNYQDNQGIPVSLPLNNTQAVVPLSSGQIESWHITLLGANINAILFLLIQTAPAGDMTLGTLFIFFIMSLIDLLFTFIFKSSNEKIRQIGAILGVILCAIIFLLFFNFFIIFIPIIPFSPFVAGIYYFWKKSLNIKH